MEVIITQWALDSYLDLKRQNVFSDSEFDTTIKLDGLLLLAYPNHPKFNNNKFWSPAQDKNGVIISDGYKMKWHNIGNGKVQLRLPVGIINGIAFLCQAYVKSDDKIEKLKLSKFKDHLRLIRLNRHTVKGRLK
ncbi:MAG: hypothetical protein P4M12_06510 [Gammaproteobacteria bacterium]|nr:hypothetical protein [Gammaproteobacteria bacterium]